jgi:hypothetical protein
VAGGGRGLTSVLPYFGCHPGLLVIIPVFILIIRCRLQPERLDPKDFPIKLCKKGDNGGRLEVVDDETLVPVEVVEIVDPSGGPDRLEFSVCRKDNQA